MAVQIKELFWGPMGVALELADWAHGLAPAPEDLALAQRLELVGGAPGKLDLTGPAVPGGLAMKVYPCCYALQRPISALTELKAAHGLRAADVRRVVLRTPAATVAPLIHHRPATGLQGKFSLEYAVATALLDPYQGFDAFADAAVARQEARELAGRVTVELTGGGELTAEVHTTDGGILRTTQQYPPGSPRCPPSAAELAGKLGDCLRGLDTDPAAWRWETAPALLRAHL